MKRHKLRNVRLRQWKRWHRYHERLPMADFSGRVVPRAWSDNEKWLR